MVCEVKKSVHSRYYGIALGNRHLLVNINNQLRGVQKSRYKQYRIVCNALQKLAAAKEQKIRKKLFRALTKPGDWEKHKIFLDRVAAPKQWPKPPEPPREPKGQYSELRLRDLAKPKHKSDGLGVDPFKVQRSALVYEITAHMERLSTRENPREDPPYNIPGQVVPEALNANASPRTIELAKPAVRQPGRETDLREDAFSVNPMALKAWCSPRLKKLAKPKHKVRRK
ncbi:hypothetical protein QAD02_014833 [Eretmocerus hayati]|uniref:Uncharacterized protein n=1 Tax=Eretmocerus hayati TaxID=131215 RepID=A0ACC2P850_9HYME|nr:hypothetical protein QAD02_014833 [Eretmocerus hayati]